MATSFAGFLLPKNVAHGSIKSTVIYGIRDGIYSFIETYTVTKDLNHGTDRYCDP
jgi:hypothetical protein